MTDNQKKAAKKKRRQHKTAKALTIHPKVAAFTVSGVVADLTVSIIEHFSRVDVSDGTTAKIAFLIGIIGGYLAPPSVVAPDAEEPEVDD